MGLTALFLLGLSCSPKAKHQSANELVVGIESYPLQLDPRFATDANAVRIGGLIYDSLLRADQQSRLSPQLASTWEMADDRTYIFELHNNVKFHDGTPLTAADVKYTYDSIRRQDTLSPKRGLLEPLSSIEIIDNHRLVFRLTSPQPAFVEQFTFGIVPQGSPPPLAGRERPPAGSGPFKFHSNIRGEQFIVDANPGYWGGAPRLERIKFRAIPDALVRVLEFKNQQIDFMQNDLEPDMLPWLTRNAGAQINAQLGTTFQYIGINMEHAILRQTKVRQAIALAIDRTAIIRHILKDSAIAANSLLSPLNWAYDATTRQWPHDPARARSLLDNAGFRDPDGDGPRPRFRLSFKTTNVDLRRRIAEILKDQLARVGIELEIRSYEWGTFYGDIKKGNFHLYSLAWVGILDPDIYYQLFHSSSIPPNGDNRGRYRNNELDRLLEKGRRTADATERKAVYGRVQQLLAEELPYIPLWWWKNTVVSQSKVAGFVPYPDGDFAGFRKTFLR